MYEVIFLSFALSMDAFAVSIGLGSKHFNNTRKLALLAAFYFGFFQGVMPLIGYLGGKSIFLWVEQYARLLAFVLLLLVGGKMIYESATEKIEKDVSKISHRVLFVLAIATSIDAMAAGFTLTLIDTDPILSCLVIGLVTLLMSYAGVFVGVKTGTWLESEAELLGGVILILIGLRVLLF